MPGNDTLAKSGVGGLGVPLLMSVFSRVGVRLMGLLQGLLGSFRSLRGWDFRV